MSESIRALLVVMVLAGTAFLTLAKPYSTVFSHSAYSHLRNTWMILVLIAFLAPSFWLFVAIAIVFLLAYLPKTPDRRVIYYLLLLCALPNINSVIPGFAGINYLFNLSYNRLIILLLLVPIFINGAQRNPHQFKLFNVQSDFLIILYITIQTILLFKYNTVTNVLRQSFMLILDIFIPYYILSRHVNSQEQFNRVLAVLLITISILAFYGIFEAAKHWLLYSNLRYNLIGQRGGYQVRAGNLRTITVFMSPITFGYVLVIGFGLLLYLKPILNWNKLFYINASILVLALLATVARGPWLGLVVLIISYVITGREKIKKITQGVVLLLLTIPILSLTPFWDKFVQLLPFIGTVRSDTIDYRERLFKMAWIVFKRNPLFGSANYRDTPEMESMRQGEGIIDVVNSYIHIALKSGLVSLSVFIFIFFGLIISIYLLLKKIPKDNTDLIRLGRVLFAILVSIMFTITTVSSIEYIPIFYWAFAGLAAGYIFMVRKIINANVNLTK